MSSPRKYFSAFYGNQVSLPHSQKPATSVCPETDRSISSTPYPLPLLEDHYVVSKDHSKLEEFVNVL
jgi:hypothetical protein